MKQLDYNLKVAIAFSSKEEFNAIVRVIDENDADDLNHIGWVKTGLKGWCLHNYTSMCLIRQIKRCARFVTKGLFGNPR